MNNKNGKKAVIYQTVFIILALAIFAAGFILESRTPALRTEGTAPNGLWMTVLCMPAAAALASLANWFLIDKYKSGKIFSNVTCLIAIVVTAAAALFICSRYHLFILFQPAILKHVLQKRWLEACCTVLGLILIVVCARVLSSVFWKLKNTNDGDKNE